MEDARSGLQPVLRANAAADAAASTRGPMRRQAMKSRIVVQLQVGSEKVVKVCAASQTEAEIGCVIAARDRAIMAEAQEFFALPAPAAGASSPCAHTQRHLQKQKQRGKHDG